MTGRPVAAALILVTAMASGPAASHVPGLTAGHGTTGMAALLARATLTGETQPDRTLHVNLGLLGRDPAGLDRLVSSGGRISPQDYAERFGPAAGAVAGLLDRLHAAGLAARWSRGSAIVAADGSVMALSRLLSVHFDDYRLDGRTFFAADRMPTLPPWMTPLVRGVDGLDDFSRVRAAAVHAGSGLTPSDLAGFYNIRALQNAHLDGAGETIAMPDPTPQAEDLAAYAGRYRLPPFNYEVRGGQPPGADADAVGEVSLDMEVIHGIAPKAKLLVYNLSNIDREADIEPMLIRVNDDMVTDNRASIVSESYGWCGFEWSREQANQLDDVLKRGVAQGITFFVSSGDEGAYGCERVDGDQHRLGYELPEADPWVTSVGGTTVFLTKEGVYGSEGVWGNPLGQDGGGGGDSQVFPRPDWQRGPGVDNQSSDGSRQVPDVAAVADPNTGYDLVVAGKRAVIGGTSGSTPLWAAITCLINQDLAAKRLRPVGFANPALYMIGQQQAQLPGPPFHDITQGNNLHFPATPGWDFATGWGSPNAGALASAWEDYIRGGGR